MRTAVEVVSVVEGSPAERAGLRPEDLIVALDGAPTASVDDVQRLMVAELIDRPVRCRLVREGRVLELTLVPAEMR
jgi:S1-C subfamily serine protease